MTSDAPQSTAAPMNLDDVRERAEALEAEGEHARALAYGGVIVGFLWSGLCVLAGIGLSTIAEVLEPHVEAGPPIEVRWEPPQIHNPLPVIVMPELLITVPLKCWELP